VIKGKKKVGFGVSKIWGGPKSWGLGKNGLNKPTKKNYLLGIEPPRKNSKRRGPTPFHPRKTANGEKMKVKKKKTTKQLLGGKGRREKKSNLVTPPFVSWGKPGYEGG